MRCEQAHARSAVQVGAAVAPSGGAAVLHEEGLEAIERAENWPPRSGKIALKLGLAQLAQQRG